MLDVLDRLFELVVNNLGLIAVGIMCLVVIVGWWTTTHMPHYPEPPCCR
jgi:4-amino-4-deoxy-L-arabinose transferase-like glycosyltransferase